MRRRSAARSRTTPGEGSQGRTDLHVHMDSCVTPASGRLEDPGLLLLGVSRTLADNGGASPRTAWTADAITVVAYIPLDSDPVLDSHHGGDHRTTTLARRLKPELPGLHHRHDERAVPDVRAGRSRCPFPGRAGHVRQRHRRAGGRRGGEGQVEGDGCVFAVWVVPRSAPALRTEEIKARGVICLGCPAVPDPAAGQRSDRRPKR